MPPQELKIDRSIVTTMCDRPRDEQIVRAVVALAKGLQLRVVAEGVETERAMTALRLLGCDEAQGYYISKPLTADDFAGWLTRHASVAVVAGEGADRGGRPNAADRPPVVTGVVG
jgi:EAL domain-containing protein (putative c-di-GMP-specific phosphodiesterase class I)